MMASVSQQVGKPIIFEDEDGSGPANPEQMLHYMKSLDKVIGDFSQTDPGRLKGCHASDSLCPEESNGGTLVIHVSYRCGCGYANDQGHSVFGSVLEHARGQVQDIDPDVKC